MQEILEIFFLEVIFGVFLLFGSYRFLISQHCLENFGKNQKADFSLVFHFYLRYKARFLILFLVSTKKI
ncbi:MAG: hypothetical protein DLD55_00735 [candidate division SR1 bacterium]|nr:MAG: hypothetical protein DLD55_00735 [candidate division SR1 bacterium]